MKRLINEFHLREVFSGEGKMGKDEIWLRFKQKEYKKEVEDSLTSFFATKTASMGRNQK